MCERTYGKVCSAFILGGIIGAGLGIFFAPRAGKDTRRRVKILFDDIGEKTGELIEEGNEKIEEFKKIIRK